MHNHHDFCTPERLGNLTLLIEGIILRSLAATTEYSPQFDRKIDRKITLKSRT
jgi:hypothetical protein